MSFDLWDVALKTANAIWNFSIVEVQGAHVTVGKLFLAILVVVFGYRIAKKISQKVSDNILKPLQLAEPAKLTIQKMVFYGLFVLVALMALQMLGIPLTALTVLGGALAIGVGFGVQNLFNNFISGLILLMEQPIRVNDFIEVDGLYGVVEAINFRSTFVKTIDNTHIVVPNSVFLENKVLNWTLSDDIVRTKVAVGVAYGSDTSNVKRILLEVAEAHGKVLDSPEPTVFFVDFGDNSLGFEIFFWARIKNRLQLRTIESDLRFMIDKKFRDNNVVIAFPQRDVHLDVTHPIPVKIMEEK